MRAIHGIDSRIAYSFQQMSSGYSRSPSEARLTEATSMFVALSKAANELHLFSGLFSITKSGALFYLRVCVVLRVFVRSYGIVVGVDGGALVNVQSRPLIAKRRHPLADAWKSLKESNYFQDQIRVQ